MGVFAVLMEATKRCTKCLEWKPFPEFAQLRLGALGRYSRCKECCCAYSKEWSKARRVRIGPRCPVARRSQKYKVPKETVRALLARETCEACGARFGSDTYINFDHRHSAGAVRGVLCDRCNRSLGLCDESEDVLLGLRGYLLRTMCVDYRTQPYLEQNEDSSATSHAEPFPPKGTAGKCQTNTTSHPISPQP